MPLLVFQYYLQIIFAIGIPNYILYFPRPGLYSLYEPARLHHMGCVKHNNFYAILIINECAAVDAGK
jgi:hypothetical protein